MTRIPASRLSVADCATLLITLTVVLPLTTVWHSSRAISCAWLLEHPIRPAAWNGFVRSVLTHVKPKYLQAILPSSRYTYESWLRREGHKMQFASSVQTTVRKKANLLWLCKGHRLNRVILFFHGGGYVMPLSDGHLNWMAYIWHELNELGLSADIAILEYSLAPQHPYPTQLSQAIDALQSLLDDGYNPRSIIIGGDSAGGHLALSLLSHLHRPRPTDDEKPESLQATPELKGTTGLKIQLAGMFLVSPFLSLQTAYPSYQSWFSADLLSAHIVEQHGACFVDFSPYKDECQHGKFWAFALDIEGEASCEEWWDGVGVVTKRVFLGVGEEEVFRDPVLKYSKVLRDVGRTRPDTSGEHEELRVELWLDPQEAHDGPLMDFAAGRDPSLHSKAIVDFIARALMP